MLLNDDILLLVFSTIFNTRDIHVEHRQATIRCASQVCQRWRNLILPASYIWGRLLWVNTKQNVKWMAEVLERAKNSTLVWMTLEPCLYSVYSEPFFGCFVLRVLNDTWERLEELDINFSYNSRCNVKKAIWQYLKTPAPKLRVFSLSSWMDDALQRTLFNNSAPLLRSFTCYNLPQPSSWLSRITTLKFTPDTVKDILSAVSWAPCLQVLHLGSQGNKPEPVHLSLEDCERVVSMSPTILARLARIDMLYLSIDEFNALWCSRYQSPAELYSHIVIRVAFDEEAPPQPGEAQELNYSGFIDALSNFFYHHAGITTANIQNYDLEWKVEADYTYIIVEVKASRVPELYMKLRFNCGFSEPDELKPFLARAVTEYARHTKNFYLTIVGNLKEYQSLEIFHFLLSSLEDVESATLDITSICYFNEMEERTGQCLFTKLKAASYKSQYGLLEEELCDLKTFLMRRVRAGHPLSTIDFQVPENNQAEIFHALKEVPGLQITYVEQSRTKVR
ncbi:hypothetical protein D9613_012943 [Agrocybe pediades]|uniref:F-box domain-containing protein n=1 Tax=Agrocybe pediades TaxID=84607 RepID=A0A8H4VIU4_9AGAR|nr:hypothetical protein D9613_012943 [Agrocybe pediades]